MAIKLGAYFTLEEMSVSQTAARRGLSNKPNDDTVKNLGFLVAEVLDPLRLAVGKPLVVTSGYRSPEINRLIGGSPTSDHVKGRAADIHQPEMSVRDLMRLVIHKNLPFDQMIDEFEGSWLHISYRHDNNRRQILEATHQGGKTWYAHVSVEELG